jgi:GT2 family glycosyltransferase
MPINHIAVLMTSFNRREVTLNSLVALFGQRKADGVYFTVFLVIDGSTDGTGEAVKSLLPEVRLLRGDGTLFWNGGMRMAFDTAMRESFDAYLFLNDDTILYSDGLERITACARTWLAASTPAIVVGSTRSPGSGNHSYGGIAMRTDGFALKHEKVIPGDSLSIDCDTMNGNVALVPRDIATVVGNVDERFRHQFGDFDYGLRAKRAGFNVVVAPGYVGECLPNSRSGTWRDSSLTFKKRWKNLTSPKGVPFGEWFFFTRRHYGWRWPYYAVSPYLKTIASSLFSSNGAHSHGETVSINHHLQ